VDGRLGAGVVSTMISGATMAWFVWQALQRAVDVAVVLAGRAPRSLAAIKESFAAGRLDVDDALAAERRIQRELYFSQDFAEGKAAFYPRREPRFTGN